MLVRHMLPLSCNREKLLNLSYLKCGPQIRQIWTNLITDVKSIAREGVQNTHKWSGWTETVTENGVGQAGSCCRCGNHLSVADQ